MTIQRISCATPHAPAEVIEEVRLFASGLRDKYLNRSQDNRWATVWRVMKRIDQEADTWVDRIDYVHAHLGEPQEITLAALEAHIPDSEEVQKHRKARLDKSRDVHGN